MPERLAQPNIRSMEKRATKTITPRHNKLHAARLGAVFLQHAGAAEFEEPRALGQIGQHSGDVVFAAGIEPAGARGIGIAHHPVAAHHHRLAIVVQPLAVHHQQVIAEIIEAVEVAPGLAHRGGWNRIHLLVEHAGSADAAPPRLRQSVSASRTSSVPKVARMGHARRPSNGPGSCRLTKQFPVALTRRHP